MKLEVQKNKSRYEVRLSTGKKKSTVYWNVLDNDPRKIAQVLIDIELVSDIPIEKAIMIYLELKKKKDWLSL